MFQNFVCCPWPSYSDPTGDNSKDMRAMCSVHSRSEWHIKPSCMDASIGGKSWPASLHWVQNRYGFYWETNSYRPLPFALLLGIPINSRSWKINELFSYKKNYFCIKTFTSRTVFPSWLDLLNFIKDIPTLTRRYLVMKRTPGIYLRK